MIGFQLTQPIFFFLVNSRMLQFASGNRSKAVLDLEKKSEFVLCIYLNELVEQWKQAVETQEIIAAQGMNVRCVRANRWVNN